MDLKKKLKAFFTMKRRANDGFTLVELIVVIAILAILGGVAIPAYSGYVKKADRAADEALLVEINTAFASACSLNGENYFLREDTALKLDGKKVVGLIIGVEKVATDFDLLFESEEVEFKSINPKQIMYVKAEGRFREAGQIAVVYKGGTLMISEKDKEAFMESGLGALGAAYLMGEMDNVVAYASDYPGLLSNVKEDPEFQKLCKMFDGYPTGDPAKDQNIELQALVMYTADQYDKMDPDEVYNKIVAAPGAYIANYDTDGEDFAANAAMYSLGLAFAKTEEGKAIMAEKGWDASNVDDIRALMLYAPEIKDEFGGGTGEYEDNAFGTWLTVNKEEAKANLEGFGGAMGMITDNKENLDTGMLQEGGFGKTGEGTLASALDKELSKPE